jgi:hypothetical protein
MCAKCIERCKRVVAALLVPAYPDPETRTWKAAQIAGAVLEAGRLSECPAAVDAANGALLSDSGHMQRVGKQALRAAEDVALGKGTK